MSVFMGPTSTRHVDQYSGQCIGYLADMVLRLVAGLINDD